MNRTGKQLAVLGMVLHLAAAFATARVVYAAIQISRVSVDVPGELGSTTVDPLQILSRHASAGIVAGWAGGFLALLGVACVILALCRYRFRAQWFKMAAWTLAVVWLFFAPVGTAAGILTIMYLYQHDSEFGAAAAAPDRASA